MKVLEKRSGTSRSSDSMQSVSKGDVVSVVDDSYTGYNLIKKDGVVGWGVKNIFG